MTATPTKRKSSQPKQHERRLHLDRRAAALAAVNPDDTTADTDLLTTAELAAWLGVTKAWVELGRVKNFGPPYLRLSAQMIRYRRSEVKAWLQERSFRHTGQYAAAEQS